MRTKAEAEAWLAQLPLTRAVAVADVGSARRSYAHANVYIEIDANPTDAQLADLVRHLPLPEDKRASALALVTGNSSG